jgi:hypothetical protein
MTSARSASALQDEEGPAGTKPSRVAARHPSAPASPQPNARHTCRRPKSGAKSVGQVLRQGGKNHRHARRDSQNPADEY